MDEFNLILSFSDDQVKDQVKLVLSIGKRTIEESFKLGEMLVQKKQEKGHGNWLPFLEEIGLSQSTAKRLINAFNEKDRFVEGMTFSELVGDIKSPDSGDLVTIQTPPPPPDPFKDWTPQEKELRERWEKGETVVLNMDTHKHLVRYASDLQVYVRIDRGTAWGNPFVMDEDGTRDEVCDWYEQHYLPFKKSLLSKTNRLKGKMLGCHCYPKRCHGEILINHINA